MANEVMWVTDPLGNTVALMQGSCAPLKGHSAEEVYDDLATVIRKPAMLVASRQGSKQMFYFRSVGWHDTILVTVQWHAERWETTSCIHNPTNVHLSELLRSGRQLI